ncbi:MAG: hypothetical protein ABSC64_16490 [Candidatus Korobacteraceae bacterium]|jgi:hypothetical protein
MGRIRAQTLRHLGGTALWGGAAVDEDAEDAEEFGVEGCNQNARK